MSTEPGHIPKGFESRVQDLIYNVDSGMSSQVIKVALYISMVMIIMIIYWVSEFWGLKEPEAMDQAQVARQLMTDGSFSTKNIRPGVIWKLEQHGVDPRTAMLKHPDIIHPPVYPWILSKLFRFVEGAFEPGQKVRTYPPEQWAIVPFGNLCTILTGLLIYLIARRFFEGRIAVIAATLFFVSDRVWAHSISGLNLPLATLLATLSVYLALLTCDRLNNSLTMRGWIVHALLTALACALAFLTRYAAGWIIVAAVITIAWLAPERGWKVALLVLGLSIAIVSPWFLRNLQVSGSPFGFTPYLALNSDSPAYPQSFERQVSPSTANAGKDLKIKWTANLARHYHTALPSSGSGILAALFITTFFFRFGRDQVHVLRFGLLAAMIGMFLTSALFGESSMRAFAIFWPFIILYGLSFFYLLIDRLQIAIPVLRSMLVALLVTLTALPLIFTLMPPRAGYPYPPYFPSYISMVTTMMNQDELLATDMPWATAWYGDRSSLLIPATLEEFYKINDIQKRISGIYFTTLTRDLPYVSGMVTGPFSSWYPIFREMIPIDFPLTEAFFISGRDQLFLTDRPRWPQR